MIDPQWRLGAVIILTFLLMIVWSQMQGSGGPIRYNIGYSQFLDQLDTNNIDSVLIRNLEVRGELKKEADVYLPVRKKAVPVKIFQTFLPSFQGEDLISKLNEKNVLINVEPTEKLSPFWQFIVGLLPWVLIIGFWILMMRGAQRVQGGPGGLFSFGASKAKLHDVQKTAITFKDVAGIENTKKDLKETIEFLKEPAKFRKLGAKVPRG
ncbi:MAG TPA: cell division protein FtsH, partial [Nitrospirae bacterium]|nr:cell division protein FtsH [Nitrospirota bacterium]